MQKSGLDVPGIGLLLMFTALLGANQVLIKIMNGAMDPVFQAGLRSAAACVPILLWCLWTGRAFGLHRGEFWPGVLNGVLFGLEFWCLFLALDYSSVARISIIFYTMPVWLAVASHYTVSGDRLTPRKIAGLVLAVLGVVLSVSSRPEAELGSLFDSKLLLGDMLALLASFCWAGIAWLAKFSPLKQCPPERQILYQLVVSAVMLLPLAFLGGDLWRDFQPVHGLIFAFQVLVVIAFGYTLWFWLLARYPASSVTSFSFLSPAFAVLFGWLVLKEQIGLSLIAALLCLSVGIMLVNMPTKIAARPSAKGQP